MSMRNRNYPPYDPPPTTVATVTWGVFLGLWAFTLSTVPITIIIFVLAARYNTPA